MFPPSFAICFLVSRRLFCPALLPYDLNLFPCFHNFWSRLGAFFQQSLAAGYSAGHGSDLLPTEPAAHSEMRPGEIQPSSVHEFLCAPQAVAPGAGQYGGLVASSIPPWQVEGKDKSPQGVHTTYTARIHFLHGDHHCFHSHLQTGGNRSQHGCLGSHW